MTDDVHLGYIHGEVWGKIITRCMVDDGSLSELISPQCVESLQLKKIPVNGRCVLRMADDGATNIEHYVVFPLVVGGILTIIRAYVVGSGESYDMLLGRGWLKRNNATIHYATEHLTLRGVEGGEYELTMIDAPKHHGVLGIEFPDHTSIGQRYRSPEVDDDDSEDDEPEWDGEEEYERDEEDIFDELVDIAEMAIVEQVNPSKKG
jgi:hypothetical protein